MTAKIRKQRRLVEDDILVAAQHQFRSGQRLVGLKVPLYLLGSRECKGVYADGLQVLPTLQNIAAAGATHGMAVSQREIVGGDNVPRVSDEQKGARFGP